MHSQPNYQRLGFKAGGFPAAERYYYAETIILPMYAALGYAEQNEITAAMRKNLT